MVGCQTSKVVSKSKALRRRQADIAAYGNALARLLEVCERHESFEGNPTWSPKPGQDLEANLRVGEVDRAAGRAALAFGHEFWIDYKPRGTFQTQPVSPATTWRTIFDRDPMFGVDVIFAICTQAIGALDARASEAEERERSLAGKIERVLPRLPRAAVAPSGHLRTAFVASIVGIPSALAVAFIAYALGWG
jgi:hypothetical protein